ncbi:hypothetical protein [Nocardia sp. NPDC051463]|uniref:hypothetical protein n=1 Tax=Nocardia sp. NPDC051463 TaxID=3154845 RepID=UPI00344DF0AE
MTGRDCDVVPEWWKTPREEMQSANLAFARDLVAHHKALHPPHVCSRLAAAAAFIALADRRSAEETP